jgi:hypothetical protein
MDSAQNSPARRLASPGEGISHRNTAQAGERPPRQIACTDRPSSHDAVARRTSSYAARGAESVVPKLVVTAFAARADSLCQCQTSRACATRINASSKEEAMKKAIIICMLFGSGPAALHAQNTQSNYDLQQSTMRISQGVNDDFQQRYRLNYVKSLADLTRLRDSLAQAWQSLGLSPQAARTVANAYKPNLAKDLGPMEGKSHQEIAAMLQSALARKDYMLANQTLIDYEQGQMHMGVHRSPVDQH